MVAETQHTIDVININLQIKKHVSFTFMNIKNTHKNIKLQYPLK